MTHHWSWKYQGGKRKSRIHQFWLHKNNSAHLVAAVHPWNYAMVNLANPTERRNVQRDWTADCLFLTLTELSAKGDETMWTTVIDCPSLLAPILAENKSMEIPFTLHHAYLRSLVLGLEHFWACSGLRPCRSMGLRGKSNDRREPTNSGWQKKKKRKSERVESAVVAWASC